MVCVCMRHLPCAGARAPEDKYGGKRPFPLWPGPTTFLIMTDEVLPSVPVVFLDRFSVSRYAQLWLALASPELSFRRGNERNLPERDCAQRPRALAPWVSFRQRWSGAFAASEQFSDKLRSRAGVAKTSSFRVVRLKQVGAFGGTCRHLRPARCSSKARPAVLLVTRSFRAQGLSAMFPCSKAGARGYRQTVKAYAQGNF